MYESYSEIPVENLITCADDDVARGESLRKYMLSLRVDSPSIYSECHVNTRILAKKQFWLRDSTDNISLAAIVIDYSTAAASGETNQLLDALRRLSDKDGFRKDERVPAYMRLDVFDPHEQDGMRRYGGEKVSLSDIVSPDS